MNTPYDLNWLKEARKKEESIRNAPVRTLMNGKAIEEMRYLLRVALDTLERVLAAPPDGISSTMLVGNVDADETLFRAAVDFAWFHNYEYAIVAVNTVIGAIDDEGDENPGYSHLLKLASLADARGIEELIFNNTDF